MTFLSWCPLKAESKCFRAWWIKEVQTRARVLSGKLGTKVGDPCCEVSWLSFVCHLCDYLVISPQW